MKKKSKSHVVLLKQRVKQRILGKSEGPSTASGEETPTHSDVPPFSDTAPTAAFWPPVLDDCADFVACQHEPIVIKDGPPKKVKGGYLKERVVAFPPRQLPVEHHGSTNDLARQVIKSVKAKP